MTGPEGQEHGSVGIVDLLRSFDSQLRSVASGVARGEVRVLAGLGIIALGRT